ncbi:hypothetical protein A306_00000214 [Columba livia]|uniref:Uncharacterized protein n=1 Tax=Columba livia TaxID=8932 RepID=A0A2I0M4R2_COLLI|nr:hypothetical protein A306_00000214 [Columba livia]
MATMHSVPCLDALGPAVVSAPQGAQPFSGMLTCCCCFPGRFEVTLVDLPGSQRSRSTWRSHYSAAHGLLFILDSSDLARMEEARKVLSRVLSHPDVSGKPILLSPVPPSAAPTPVPPALPCRGCAGSSASFPPPRYRCPSRSTPLPRGSPSSLAVLSPLQGPAASPGGCRRRRRQDGGEPAVAAHPPPPRGGGHEGPWEEEEECEDQLSGVMRV